MLKVIPRGWFCEIGEDGPMYVSDLHGIVASVLEDADGEWFWSVEPSGERCEYRECWATGSAKTADEAVGAAYSAQIAADEAYGWVKGW